MQLAIKIINQTKLIFFLYFGRLKSYFFRVNNLDSPDRKILEEIIFPEFYKNNEHLKILFVGCEWYTAHYKDFFKNQEFWTMDFNKSVARFGSTNHIIDKLENLDHYFNDESFDIIICNGILGFGTDDPINADIVFKKCFSALKTNGIFLLGWNKSDQVESNDPRNVKSLSEFKPMIFEALGVDRYFVLNGSSHIFDFYLKINAH
jgi:hypothetical protein